jgi:hypothetical protein
MLRIIVRNIVGHFPQMGPSFGTGKILVGGECVGVFAFALVL